LRKLLASVVDAGEAYDAGVDVECGGIEVEGGGVVVGPGGGVGEGGKRRFRRSMSNMAGGGICVAC